MPSTHDTVNDPNETPTTIRARIGGATRRGNKELADEARRDLKVITIEQRVRELVESWPPPTPEQSKRIGALLGFITTDDMPPIPQQRNRRAGTGRRSA